MAQPHTGNSLFASSILDRCQPLLGWAVIDARLIGFAEQFHGPEQGAEMIGPKIGVEKMSPLPLLFDRDAAFISSVMAYATVQATGFEGAVFGNNSANVEKFMFFLTTRMNCD